MSRANWSQPSHRRGFTLVEMLVVAPVALLVITGFIALMVIMVGDVIASRTYNTMTYDVQDALSTIERDVHLSTEFLTNSGTMPSPQGKNGSTSAFSSSDGDLILGSIATDKNPLDPTRRFSYYRDAPFGCDSDELYKNRIFFVTVAYFVRDDSLWRRTYVPTSGGDLCQTPWQVNTCAPDYSSEDTRCQTNDTELLKNVSDFTISYYENPEDTVAISSSAASTASTIRISLESQRTAAGRPVEASSSARATKLSSREINLPPPSAPTVTGSRSGTDAIFTWPGVPNATSYIVSYNINGADWILASENTTENVFSVTANHGDVVSVQVRSRNTTGTSTAATASTEIPLWFDCGLQNGWENYSGYASCGFTKTRDGVVIVKGLVRNGPTTGSRVVIFNLPPGYQPAHELIFGATIGGNSANRVNVSADGRVSIQTASGNASSYLSLNDIRFIPTASSSHAWTSLSFQNGWTNWGGGHPPLRTMQDGSGRIQTHGVIKQGTFTAGTTISTLPSGFGPSYSTIIPTFASTGSNFMYYQSNGNITPWGTTTGDSVSINSISFPASYANWQNFTEVSGAPGTGQIGNGWIRYSTSFPPPRYTKSNDNVVSLSGMIRNGNTTNGTVIAVLPVGHRPSARLVFTSFASPGNYARVDVLPNGEVVSVVTGATWTNFDNISFIAEQ